MKNKIREIFDNEQKRMFLIIVATVLVLLFLGLVIMTSIESEYVTKEPIVTSTTTKRKDIFRGFKQYVFADIINKNITYDLKQNYEFIYAKGEDRKVIYTLKNNLSFAYELNLTNGEIVFKQERYNKNLESYEFTGK